MVETSLWVNFKKMILLISDLLHDILRKQEVINGESLVSREDKGDREGIPHTHPIP